MLRRQEVEGVYDALSASPRRLMDLGPLLPQYTPWELQWAVGTLIVQGIAKLGDQASSDRVFRDPIIDIVQPFSGYVGCESAK